MGNKERKLVLIGTFVKKEKILSFLERLKNDFSLSMSDVCVNEIEGNESEYIVTFRAFDKGPYLSRIEGSSVMHVKNKSIFSINALNMLIEREMGDDKVPNRDYKLDWSKYRSKLIMAKGGELYVKSLKKIEDKTILLA